MLPQKIGLLGYSLLLLILASLPVEVNAQNLRFGLSLNPVISWLNIENEEIKRKGAKVNVGYGLLVDYHFTEQYALSSGLFFSPMGGNFENNIAQDTTGRIELLMSYVDIPINLKLKTIEYGYLTYFAQAGLTTAFSIRNRYTQPSENITNKRANEVVKPFNVSLTIGGGIEYSLGELSRLFAGLYFHNGFSDIVKDNDGQRISLNNMMIRTGILF